MKEKEQKSHFHQTCRICFIYDTSVVVIPCSCSFEKASGAHIDCLKYWMNHLKKFHTSKVRNFFNFDEIDCESCEQTIVLPKKRRFQCQSWSQIKRQKDVEILDYLPDIFLAVILLMTLAIMLYFTVMSFIDTCSNSCLPSKIIFTIISFMIFLFTLLPLNKLKELFMREEVGRVAFRKIKIEEQELERKK